MGHGQGMMPNGSTTLSQAMRLVLGNRRREAIELLREHVMLHPQDDVVAGALTRLLDVSESMEMDLPARPLADVIDEDDWQFLQQQAPGEPAFDCMDPESTCPDAVQRNPVGVEAAVAPGMPGREVAGDLATLAAMDEDAVGSVDACDEMFGPASEAMDSLLEGVDSAEPEFATPDSVDSSHEIAWEDFALGDEDHAEPDDAAGGAGPAVPQLSHRQRAEQVGAHIAAAAGWDDRECEVLIDILTHFKSHGRTRAALSALIEGNGATADELRVAHQWRQLWAQSPYRRSFHRAQATGGWPNCSWKLTLRLIRELAADDVEQMESFVDDCFSDWSDTPSLVNGYPSFSGYLDRVVTIMERRHVNGRRAMPAFIDYDLFADDDDEYRGWRINHTRFPFGYSVVETMC